MYYNIETLTWSQNLTLQGRTDDLETALIAARVLSVRDCFRVVYVYSRLEDIACYGEPSRRAEFKRFRYSREKRELLAVKFNKQARQQAGVSKGE